MKYKLPHLAAPMMPIVAFILLAFQTPCISQNNNAPTAASPAQSKNYYQLIRDLNTLLKRPSAKLPIFNNSFNTFEVTVSPKGGLVVTHYLNSISPTGGVTKKKDIRFAPIFISKVKETENAFIGPAYAAAIEVSYKLTATKFIPQQKEIVIGSNRTGVCFTNRAEAQIAVNLINDILNCTTPNIDLKFIASPDVEGSSPKVHWPGNDSGVTIATGIDLHQKRNEINSWPISDELKKKLLPYSVPVGTDADAYIKSQNPPLTIEDGEAALLDSIVQGKESLQIISMYDKATKSAKFVELPKQAQTVIFSLYHQYGPSLPQPGRGEKFWKAVTSQQWDVAQKELLNYDGVGKTPRYLPRRKAEANLLSQIGTKDIVP